jgi:hypothetical protein
MAVMTALVGPESAKVFEGQELLRTNCLIRNARAAYSADTVTPPHNIAQHVAGE